MFIGWKWNVFLNKQQIWFKSNQIYLYVEHTDKLHMHASWFLQLYVKIIFQTFASYFVYNEVKKKIH